MATLKDVARLAMVSTSTASRILHGGKIRVSQATRDRVLAASATLNYRPNALARSLRTRVTRTLGIVIPDIENPVDAQIVAGAEEAALAQGYALLVMNSSTGERRRAFIERLLADRLDGLIVADPAVDEPWILQLRAVGRPFLLINRRGPEGTSYVLLDDAGAAALGIQHLVDLGHREIAYLAGPPGLETAETRRTGVLKRCRDAGIELRDDRIISCGLGGEGVDSALDRILGQEPKVTAIATGSLFIAFRAARSLQQRGLRIPEDLSLVGFHDTPAASFATPGITTVETPLRELGRRAIGNLLRWIDEGVGGGEMVANPSPRLVVRQSTAPPKR